MSAKDELKKEFSRKLYTLMLSNGWNQSELARQADLPRDAVSVYMRGISLPTPLNLQKLANAFGMNPDDLLKLRNAPPAAADFELRALKDEPGSAWVRVDRKVSMATAIKIAEALTADKSA